MILARYFIIPSIHPLLPITISFIIGIIIQWHAAIAISTPSFLILPALLLIVATKLSRPAAIFVLCCAALIIGIWLYARQQNEFDQFHEKFSGAVCVRGKVVALEPIDSPRFNYQLTMAVSTISLKEGAANPVNINILFYLKKKPRARIGDTIEIDDLKIKRPAQSFAQFLIKQGCVASCCIGELKETIIQRDTRNFWRSVDQIRHTLLQRLEKKLAPATFELVCSIFLGNRAYVKRKMDKTKDCFKIWGISHYLARSGLHVVLFIMLWHFLLSLFPFSYRCKQLLLVTLILLYALLSWNSISFERAVLMFILSRGTNLFGYANHYIHVITLATLFVLILNPFQLFFLDFQLSFGFTFALAWFGQLEAAKRKSLIAKA
jgi:competence protein ComEC